MSHVTAVLFHEHELLRPNTPFRAPCERRCRMPSSLQGPTNLAQLLKMGVPADELRLVGHWIPKDLVNNLDSDCAARIERATKGKPLRLLIPVGGAGAQRKFVCSLIQALGPRIRVGHLLSSHDHPHRPHHSHYLHPHTLLPNKLYRIVIGQGGRGGQQLRICRALDHAH